MTSRSLSVALAVAAAIVFGAVPAVSQTLDAVKQRGSLNCGVSTGLRGFSQQDDSKVWTGFDVDFCRAVAAAIFNDATKVTYTPLDATARFAALKDGKIDILSRNTTWTMSRETEFGFSFAGVTYYDGQGFMLNARRKADSLYDLDGARICVQTNTTTQANLADVFKANNLKYDEARYDSLPDLSKAYNSGQCDVFTSDISQLYAERLNLTKPADHVILPDVVSKEPLGPAVRSGDDQWLKIVRWTNAAMINAEELGITSQNVDQAIQSSKPDVRRLVGAEGNYGEQIGLTADWAARLIRLVGNYGEVYERNVGSQSKLGIPRGLNQLWNSGGIQYAPPIR